MKIFGVMVAFGIMVAWILTITFIPAYTMLIPANWLRQYGVSKEQKGPGKIYLGLRGLFPGKGM